MKRNHCLLCIAMIVSACGVRLDGFRSVPDAAFVETSAVLRDAVEIAYASAPSVMPNDAAMMPVADAGILPPRDPMSCDVENHVGSRGCLDPVRCGMDHTFWICRDRRWVCHIFAGPCVPSGLIADAGMTTIDAGRLPVDAAGTQDTGTDTGVYDAATPEAAGMDAVISDAGQSDTASADAAVPDVRADTAAPDIGMSDAVATDVHETGIADASWSDVVADADAVDVAILSDVVADASAEVFVSSDAASDAGDADASFSEAGIALSCGGDSRVGTICTAGIGACARTAPYACSASNMVLCTASPGPVGAEICGNMIDEDCNGSDLVCPPVGSRQLEIIFSVDASSAYPWGATTGHTVRDRWWGSLTCLNTMTTTPEALSDGRRRCVVEERWILDETSHPIFVVGFRSSSHGGDLGSVWYTTGACRNAGGVTVTARLPTVREVALTPYQLVGTLLCRHTYTP